MSGFAPRRRVQPASTNTLRPGRTRRDRNGRLPPRAAEAPTASMPPPTHPPSPERRDEEPHHSLVRRRDPLGVGTPMTAGA